MSKNRTVADVEESYNKALPFEPLTPNAKTIKAMKAARRGELERAVAPEKLIESLNAGDCGKETA